MRMVLFICTLLWLTQALAQYEEMVAKVKESLGNGIYS